MPQKPRAGILLAAAIVAFLVPVLVSAYLAWWQSYSTEKTLGLICAEDVEHRMKEIASQLQQSADKLSQAGLRPCSPQDVRYMRQVALDSSYTKAVGRVAHGALLCTSDGVTIPIALGRPDLVTQQGVMEYSSENLGALRSHPLKVFVLGAFAMIVDPSLALDVPTEGQGVELAVFVPSSAKFERVAALGQDFPSNWFDATDRQAESTMLDDGYVVSSVRSPRRDLGVVVATPDQYLDWRAERNAAYFVPIGMICGAILSLMVSFLLRMHSPFPTMLRRAMKDGSLYVLYQPVVELSTRRVIGAEAVVRWKTTYAEMRPDYFIPLAEQCGLIQLLTERILDMVARDMPLFLAIDPHFRIAVNMSAADLRDSHTLDVMDRFLQVSGASPANVEIEATERAFLETPETTALISALRKKGFSVAIDDFGTGYSSLACLQSLSLDTLKIDRAFVETINTGGATSQVVMHIIEMAHELRLYMVAEGVETEPQAQYLQKHGVHFAQGWQFGRPLDIAPLCEQLRVNAAAYDGLALTR